MANYQSNSNARVALKKQLALGSAAGGAGGSVLRTAGGAGIKVGKAAVESAEIRSDGLSMRGRHGSQNASSAYNAEMSLGSHDAIVEAVMRGTWDTAPLTATQADMTSVTTGANSIVAQAGNWLTKGFRKGDVIRAANLADAANNGRNIRLVDVTASTLTTAETLTMNAAPDNAFSIIRPGKRIINPATLLKSYYTLEEYEADIDETTVLEDFVWGNLKFSMGTNGIIMADPGGIGTGKARALTAGEAPLFINPVATTATPMSVVDATIRFGNVDLVELSAFDISMDIQPAAPATFGSGAQKYSPDVFTGPLKVGLNLTMLRKSLAIFSDFLAETPYSLHVLCVDNTAEPKDFLSITVPNFTLGSVDPSALSKQGGGRTQTISIPPALVGVDTAANGNNSMISLQTTAAA